MEAAPSQRPRVSPPWPVRWEPFFLLARALSALAGTLTIYLIYCLARRLFDPLTGVVAAALLAVAFLHARDSHFGVTDVSMVMLVVAAVLALVRAHDEPSPVRFLWAGLLAGLATSTKYNALLLVAPLAVSQWLQARDDHRIDRRMPLFLAAMAFGFLAGTPFSLVDRAQFLRDASGEAAHLAGGHGIRLGIGWRYHLLVSLWHGLTWPVLVAALTGSIWMIARVHRRRTPAAVRERLTRYDLRRAFHAVDVQAPHVYDQQDAFFLPLAGLGGVGRPGPNIYVFQRR